MSAGLIAALALASHPVTAPYEATGFIPLSPDRPEGPAIRVLRGDPATGPSDMLMRFGSGEPVMHAHSADYRLVVISGRMKHWAQGESEADASEMGPGSYWFQPAGQAHSDRCLSEICVMFIAWSGPRDAYPADSR